MNKRALVESIVVSLSMAFARYTPMAQVHSLAVALRANAERRERERQASLARQRQRNPGIERDAASAAR